MKSKKGWCAVWVSLQAVTLLCFGREPTLKKKQQLKEFVPEGLTQGRAENLGAVMFPFCLPPSPASFLQFRFQKKKKTKTTLESEVRRKKEPNWNN